MANLLMLDLLSRYTRPVIMVNNKINCLIDTGADTPVWTMGKVSLKDEFNAVLLEDKQFILSGFGKNAEVAEVYQIPELVLSDSKEDFLTLKNMIVACTFRPSMIAQLILPATILSHMNYTIRNIGINRPRIEIEHEKNEYFVNPVYNRMDNRYVQKVYSFVMEEST